MPLERHHIVLRAADQQNSKQFFLAAQQRHRVKHFRVRRIRSPVDFCNLLPGLLLLLLDDRCKLIRLRRRPRRIDQVRCLKRRIEIPIQQRPHSRRKHERRDKFPPQPFPANNVKILIAHAHARHRQQRQRRPLLRIRFHQKRAARHPILRLQHPVNLVTKSRRPFRRRNNRPVVADEIQKIELMRFRHPRRIIHVHRHIALRPAQINRHPHRAFRVGNALHPMHHVLARAAQTPSGTAPPAHPNAAHSSGRNARRVTSVTAAATSPTDTTSASVKIKNNLVRNVTFSLLPPPLPPAHPAKHPPAATPHPAQAASNPSPARSTHTPAATKPAAPPGSSFTIARSRS